MYHVANTATYGQIGRSNYCVSNDLSRNAGHANFYRGPELVMSGDLTISWLLNITFPRSFRAVFSFPSSFRAVLEQFQSSFRVSVQFLSSFSAVSELRSSFRAVSEQFPSFGVV